jgi:hypothetical protein
MFTGKLFDTYQCPDCGQWMTSFGTRRYRSIRRHVKLFTHRFLNHARAD